MGCSNIYDGRYSITKESTTRRKGGRPKAGEAAERSVKVHKFIDGKTRCDDCRATDDFVCEVELKIGKRVSHWMDLCTRCIRTLTENFPVEYHKRVVGNQSRVV